MARVLLIAGGGTGGHLFPGLAVAEEFVARGPELTAVFLGTAQGIEARRVPAAGYEFVAIRSRGIAGKGAADKLRGLLTIPLSLVDAARAVRRVRPGAMLGVGGFVSGPAVLAGWLLGVPCAIQEQNTVPGWTNRILSRIAAEVFISFEPARAMFAAADRKGRVTLAGNPVRKKIAAAIGAGRRAASPDGRLRVLVVGGSQGAHGLNLLMVAAAKALTPAQRERLAVRHQTGAADESLVAEGYRAAGVSARVEAFIEEMAGAYGEADLIVSRAGAGAVAEIALAGLPAILVPYPHAASDHQAGNAAALVAAGAAMMLREGATDGPALAAAIAALMDDPDRRAEMAAAARREARPGAAAVIVDCCLALMTVSEP
jgi:UDP-N-acetylglucosamine--N-acetylmuramyl-(pentapeptide) pyrophosphoryl-undecaprenol N-acetylglucosamine transferase